MKNKFNLSQKQNRFLVKKNFVNMVYSNSKFEGVNTTLPQTQTIIDGMSVGGVPMADIQVIVNLKKGLEFVLAHDEPFTIEVSKKKLIALSPLMMLWNLVRSETGTFKLVG